MKRLRILICLALAIASPLVFADTVRRCKDANGHVFLTDRLCGDPGTEQAGRQPSQIAVDQINADDIFRARPEQPAPALPVSPNAINSRDIPVGPQPMPEPAGSGR